MIVSDLVSLNSQQQEILQGMEDTLDHLFITGRAGTGKTTLLHEFVATTAKSVAVCAPTGVAALAIGGQTIHSLLRLPLGFLEDKRELGFIPRELLGVLAALDVLVIDEVSMVSADVLDAIDRRLRQAKRRRNSPFGGIQMIMFGDPYQLAPVVTPETKEQYLAERYRSPWFFDAKVWSDTEMTTFELDTIHRQADGEFRSVLNALREGRMDPEMGQMLNQRCFRRPVDTDVITLTVTNALASKINSDALAALPGPTKKSRAIIDPDFGHHYPADEELLLKVDARVMFLRNDTAGPDGPRFANGTIGTIKKIKADTVIVEVDGAAIEVEPMTWQKTAPVVSAVTKMVTHRVLGEFTQFPLRLAWAVTIHKAQGKTLDAAVIDLGQRAFAPGQTYVAFSRLTSLDGLYLRRPLSPSDIIVDQDVLRFMSNPRGTNRLI